MSIPPGSHPGYQYGQAVNRPGYVQPQAGQQPTDWTAPGSYGGPRPWDQGAGGAPLAPLQQAPKPRSKWTPAVLPLDGQDYASAYRPLTKRWGRWFAVGAIAAGFFMFGQIPITIWMLTWMFSSVGDILTGAPLDPMDAISDLMGSPWFLLLTNFSWAVMIPGSILAMAVYGPKAWRFVLSVTGKWRWDVTLKSFGLIAPFFALYIGAMLFMSVGGDGQWNPNWLLVIVVLLTTPLQSAGEEFFFRGVLTQQIAGWIPRPVIGSLVAGGVTGIIFGAMHMHGFTLPTLQLMFVGFVCSLLTWRTGGLESASVLHACNNVFIMLPLALMGFGAFDPNAPGAEEPGTSFGAELLVFAMATAAMALSYAAVHFGLRKEQRLTKGAPGSEALLAPSAVHAHPYAGVAAPTAPGYPAPYAAPVYGPNTQEPAPTRWAPPGVAQQPPTQAPPTQAPPSQPMPSAPAQSTSVPSVTAYEAPGSAPSPYAVQQGQREWRSGAHPAPSSVPSEPNPNAPAPNPYAPPKHDLITSVPTGSEGVIGYGLRVPNPAEDPSRPGHESVNRDGVEQGRQYPGQEWPLSSTADFTSGGARGGSQTNSDASNDEDEEPKP